MLPSFLIPHGSNLHDLPGSSDAVETKTGLHYRDFKVPSLVPEISSSGSKVPGTLRWKRGFSFKGIPTVKTNRTEETFVMSFLKMRHCTADE